jgi:hypothetical protein
MYLEYFKHECKSIVSTEAAINAHILPTLGNRRIDELTIRP